MNGLNTQVMGLERVCQIVINRFIQFYNNNQQEHLKYFGKRLSQTTFIHTSRMIRISQEMYFVLHYFLHVTKFVNDKKKENTPVSNVQNWVRNSCSSGFKVTWRRVVRVLYCLLCTRENYCVCNLMYWRITVNNQTIIYRVF